MYWHKNGAITMVKLERKVHKTKVKALLNAGYISEENGNVSIQFLDEQLVEFIDLKEKRSKAGKLGGEASVKQRQSKKEPKVNHLEVDKKKIREEVDKKWFVWFWHLYNKKKDKKKCIIKCSKLKKDEKELIIIHLPKYVESTPDIQYRKDPTTYLNGECWNDEIIIKSSDDDIPSEPDKNWEKTCDNVIHLMQGRKKWREDGWKFDKVREVWYKPNQ